MRNASFLSRSGAESYLATPKPAKLAAFVRNAHPRALPVAPRAPARPLRGAAVGVACLLVFLLCWKLYICLAGGAALLVLAARAYDSSAGQRARAWFAAAAIDLLAGTPFLLLLLLAWLAK